MYSSKRPSLILAGCAAVSLASLSLATASRAFPAWERQAPQPAAQNPAANQSSVRSRRSAATLLPLRLWLPHLLADRA